PRINTAYWYKCELDRSSKRIYISNPSDISNLYTYQWRATGPITSTGGGDQFYFGSSIPGTYTITATRNYSGGVSGPSSSYSRVFTVFNRYHPVYGCNEGDDNDGDGFPDPIARIASQQETEQDSIVSNIHNLKVWPNPVSGELHVAYELLNEGDVIIKLIPINSNNYQETIITDSFRPTGNYKETFYTDHLSNGYYQLIVQTNSEILEQKIILK
ncbi:MAG TPA: hypothetical protein ACFCUD_12430, partial [Cyclobacteriaceae bacterium]